MTESTIDSNLAAHVASTSRKRAVLYLRVSTLGQVQTDYDPEGNSIPAQRVAGQEKATSLNADVVNEFVEPGKSATSIDRRPRFRDMIAWVKAQGNIDYIIVYHFNRVFRDSVDAGVVKRDLKKYGTRVVSTVLDMGEGPEASLVETIIHAVDQYQSQASGADIKYKMGQKVKNGGSVGQAKLGYLNVREAKPEGGEIRTIAVDPERSPFVVLAFELYGSGDWTLADLSDELYDRRLRTRATAKHPAQQASIHKLDEMLRDRYYLGFVTHDGQEYQGRHQPLIDRGLFNRVQELLDSRSTAEERRRVHHHYLKGSVFCGRCQQSGRVGRMIIQHIVNRHGSEYTYFFCRNKQAGTCHTPHVNVLRVEEAIEAHYATLRFSTEFIASVRSHVAKTLEDEEAATRLLHRQLTGELRALDVQEDNLINLAATTDPGLSAAVSKIHAKLRDIQHQRQHLTERLGETNDELATSARLIELCLRLLEHPQELYLRCDDEQRRLLNQALFEAIYIDHDEVSGHDLKEPFAALHRLQHGQDVATTDKPDPGTPAADPEDSSRAVSRSEDGPAALSGVDALLGGIALVQGSSKPPKVELRGIEPLTYSMRTSRATNCATAPCGASDSIAGGYSPTARR